MAPSEMIGWECGACTFTNKDCARRDCLVCMAERPERYAIVVGAGASASARTTTVNRREQAHLAAADAWAKGRLHESVSRYARIAMEHPRDLFAVQSAHAGSFFTGRQSDLRDIPLQALRDWLSHAQATALDRHAPPRIELDTGRPAKIDYTRPEEPSVAVFIQQLFKQRDTPKIAGGRVPLVMSILAPNHRPIQVTRDLAGFWKNHYPAIKKEMERRYPRHEWREM